METYKVSIGLLGDSNVGKTSLCTRLKYNIFENYNVCTIGVEFFSKLFNIKTSQGDMILKWNVYDTAGQELYQSMITSYYRKCCIFILGFDLTNLKSFQNVSYWISQINKYNNYYYKIYLFGNKLDKLNEVCVKIDQVKNLIEKHNLDYFEISVKKNKGIDDMIRHINQDIGENILNDYIKINYHGIVKLKKEISLNKDNSKNSCC